MYINNLDNIRALLGYCPTGLAGTPLIYLKQNILQLQDLDIYCYHIQIKTDLSPELSSEQNTFITTIYKENPSLQRSAPSSYLKIIVVSKGDSPYTKSNRHLEKYIHGFYLDHQINQTTDFQDDLDFDYYVETPPLEDFPVLSVFVASGCNYFVLLHSGCFQICTLDEKHNPTIVLSTFNLECDQLLTLFLEQWKGIDNIHRQRIIMQCAYYKKSFIAAIWENRLFWIGIMTSRGACSVETSLSGDILSSQRLLRSVSLPTLPCRKITHHKKTSHSGYRFYYSNHSNFHIANIQLSE